MEAGKIQLEIDGLNVDTGSAHILKDISLNLFPGELCALIGPSGAGKSTFIKSILGLREISRGQILVNGSRACTDTRTGYVPQHDALHKSLTVRDALHYSSQLRLPGLSEDKRQKNITTILDDLELLEHQDKKIKRLSGGQRKRVSVALELLTRPTMLILDEPTSGLDPGLERQMMSLFAKIAKQGHYLLVATHAMQSLKLCDALIIIAEGYLVYFGPSEAALDYFAVEQYAGIFEQLKKQSIEQWASHYASSGLRSSFLQRKPGIATAPVITATPSSGTTRTQEEILAEIKNKRNTS